MQETFFPACVKNSYSTKGLCMKKLQQFLSFGKVVFTVTGTLITTTLFSNPVLAQFHGYFPGTMCQPIAITPYYLSILNIVYLPDGLINLSSSQTIGVTCPIPQRYPEDDAGGSKRSALIFVSKSNSQKLECDLYAQDPATGQAVYPGGSVTTNATGSSILIYTSPISKSATYNLQCELPPGSKILNYQLYEPQ
ncbi:MAG: hypothetical protein JOZ78_17415 [Chroococcidiopsidaceae cyanobacterium CP_BM_ER_R8_30]|nr:hypothetical protein [Chroococcidiopsidaceae cyanobacterium CP_BM_ER_R8_30]